MSPAVGLAEVQVGDEPRAWSGAGFTVDQDGACRVGSVRIRLVGRERGSGLLGWALRGLPAALPGDLLDGVPTEAVEGSGASNDASPPAAHPNGVTTIDHVVLMSPDLARTVQAFATLGLEPRRERDGVLGGAAIRQIFFRLGDTIVEVVGSPDRTSAGPATLWGITYVVADIDVSAAYFGAHTSPVKDAVQPGRRITTVRTRELGMSVRTALISPHLRAADR